MDRCDVQTCFFTAIDNGKGEHQELGARMPRIFTALTGAYMNTAAGPGGSLYHFAPSCFEAPLCVQLLTDQLFRPSSPEEIHTQNQPPGIRKAGQNGQKVRGAAKDTEQARKEYQDIEDVRQIKKDDIESGRIRLDYEKWLGRYSWKARTIVIYSRAIDHFATVLGWDAEALDAVVHLHEYCHAVVHLGTFAREDEHLLCANPTTDWQSFLGRRNSFYERADSDAHEFLAQLLTWHVINAVGSAKLRKVFLDMMKFQSPEYCIDVRICQPGGEWFFNLLLFLLVCRKQECVFGCAPKPSGPKAPCRGDIEGALTWFSSASST